MPTKAEPRIVVRVGSEDHGKLQTAAEVAGVGISTLLRECACRNDHYRIVAQHIAAEKGRLVPKPSAPEPTMPPPTADPVPPSAFKFRCPTGDCSKTFGSPLAVCPDHGRRAVAI